MKWVLIVMMSAEIGLGVMIGLIGGILLNLGWGLFLFGRSLRWRIGGLGVFALSLLWLGIGYSWGFGLLG